MKIDIKSIIKFIPVNNSKNNKKSIFLQQLLYILISSNKTSINLGHRDLILYPVYITMENLDAKIWQSQKWLAILLLSFIAIVYKQSENAKNKDKDLKIKIYQKVLKTML